MCWTVVETDVLLIVVGVCDCDLYRQVVMSCLKEWFVSVILGTKPQSEQGQEEGARSAHPPVLRRALSIDVLLSRPTAGKMSDGHSKHDKMVIYASKERVT
jgi:hypothetical protein